MDHAKCRVIEEVLPEDQRRFYLEVGSRIRDARLKRTPRLTQEALAKMVGLTRTSITNVEQGRQKCLLHTLADIAATLHVAVESLIPPRSLQATDLDGALKSRPRSEQDWILSAVKASQQAKTHNGS